MKKRIISALTSLAMSASFIIGTLPATVQTLQAAAADITYTIADVEGEAGADVDVPITIKGDTGTAGMVLELSADSKLKLKRRLNGNAYEGAPTWNASTFTFVWNAGDGRNLVAADGAVLTTLRFTVPADAQPGDTYPISFRGSESKVIDQDGNAHNVTYVDGSITIPGGATTTTAAATTAAPTTTTKAAAATTTQKVVSADLTYEIATVEGEAGADVDVPITIQGTDPGTAGMVLELSADSNLKLKRRLNGTAYEGAPTWNATTLTYVWNAGDGRNLVAKDGATLTTLKFTVPADAKPGDEYPITFRSDLCKVIDQDGNKLDIALVGGKIVIPATATTAAETTTTKAAETTTTQAAIAVDLTYEIATVEGEAGADVDVPITIQGTDPGTAGMVLELSADSNLKLKRRLNGTAYEGAPTWNATTLTYVWNAGDGRNLVAKDGATLTTLKFTVPADAKPGDEYPITFRSDLCKVIDQDGNKLDITFTDGKIIIPDATTTTEEVTTTTAAETTTTTAAATTTTAAATTTSAPATTTTAAPVTTTLPDAGAVTYVVPTVTAAAGDEVSMPVQVLGDPGTAGVVIDLESDARLGYVGYTAGVYAGGQWNQAKLIYSWSSGEGENVTADNEAAMFNVTFKVPDDAKPGDVFPITFESAEAVDTFGSNIDVVTVDGAIIIPDVTTTTTEEVTTTTTAAETTTTAAPVSTTLPDAGAVTYVVPTVTAAAGDEVSMPVQVLGDPGTAGVVIDLESDARLGYVGYTAGVYAGGQWNQAKLIYSWSSGEGENVTADNEAAMFNVTFKVPDDAKPGDVFPITFESAEAVDTFGSNIDVVTVDGAIIIPDVTTTTTEEVTTTTTAAETTTTTAAATTTTEKVTTTTTAAETTTTTAAPVSTTLPDAGAVTYVVPTVTAAAGDEVSMPVQVLGDPGTAGVVIDLESDARLGYVGYTAGVYAGGQWNQAKLIYSWSSGEGENVTADNEAAMFNVTFKVPDDAKPGDVFPITFESAEAVDTFGSNIDVVTVDGAIIIPDVTTTTTEEVTTTTTAAETTTTTAAATTTTAAETTTTTAAATTTTAAETTTTTEEVTTTTTAAATTTTEEVTTTTTVAATTTTAPTTTTTTTESTTVTTGRVNYQIAEVEAQPGEKVPVPVYVINDTGTLGLTVQFTADSRLKYQSNKAGDAYTGMPVWNAASFTLNWNLDAAETAKSGAVLTTLTYKVPDDAQPGDRFPVEFVVENCSTVDENGNTLTVGYFNGAIYIPDPDATTTSTTEAPVTTTTTTTTTEAVTTTAPVTTTSESISTTMTTGRVNYQIAEVEAQPGEKVPVPVYVVNDTGTLGLTVQFTADSRLKYQSNAAGNAYTGMPVWDAASYTLNWSLDTAETAKSGAVLTTLTYKVPDDAQPGDRFPVEFVVENCSTVDENGNALTVGYFNGAIYIPDPDATTTSTTEASVTTTTTTTTTAAETTVTSSEVTTVSTTETTVTSSEVTTVSTTETTVTSSEVTTVSTTETTATTSETSGSETTTETSVSQSFSFTEPTRVCYWSHDNRPFDLEGLKVILQETIFIIHEDGTVVEAEEQPAAVDITEQCMTIFCNDKQVATPEDTYETQIYKYMLEFAYEGNPDVIVGTHQVLIGVKGDTNLSGDVTVADAVEILMYRADMMANPNNPTYVFNEDPDLHKLGYFLGNVDCIKEGDDLNVADAVNILMFRAEVLANGSATWEQIVGYDLIDPSDESTFRTIEKL
ncbi:cohesin domain-containing protein [Ruminococcus champanellensis]|uniref:cohesin domain-containing protein n=1 Tax=Ruminococcus champanellensis TaxID=1161942 RepID=UPI00248C4227|nr:cohesin domain-containing protein [Ruminococcus champanellensis]